MSSSTCRFSKIAPFAAKRRQFAVFAHEQALYRLMLVIQGGKDFRVPERQAMEAFGTAQLRGMPSRFLVFAQRMALGAEAAERGALAARIF